MVRVVEPLLVSRVGYPRSVKDYLADVKDEAVLRLFGDHFPHRMNSTRILGSKAFKRIKLEIAYTMAKEDGFGGRQRSIHTTVVPEIRDRLFLVESVRIVQTGVYYPPSGGYSTWSDDYENGGLEDRKTHRLLKLPNVRAFEPMFDRTRYLDSDEIEDVNVVKVEVYSKEHAAL